MKTITCTTCQLVNWGTAESCKRCGAIFSPADETPSQFVQAETPQFGDRATNAYSHPRPERATRQSQPTASPSSRLAIWSLILGILAMPPFSLFGIGIVAGLLIAFLGGFGVIVSGLLVLVLLPSGLVTGIISINRASKSPQEFGGKGFAIAGIVLSSFALMTIPIVAAIAIPNLLAARRAANEGAAISTLRKIRDLQSDYMAENQGKCGDMSRLDWVKDPKNPSLNTKSGYHFVLTHSPGEGCEIHARPLVTEGVTQTGTRSFSMSSFEGWEIVATDQSGQKKLVEEYGSRPQRADGRNSGLGNR